MRLADDVDTSSDTRGDLARFVEGRERALGDRRDRLSLPRDPEVAVEALAEALGGRWAAGGWLATALEFAEAEPRYWRDHHGNRVWR